MRVIRAPLTATVLIGIACLCSPIGRTDAKVAEKAVEIDNQAKSKAEIAEKAARGKILWTTTLSDDSVKFSFDGSTVPSGAQPILDELASKVKNLDKTVYLEIEGHTDNIGSDAHNQHLAKMRAEAVRDYLAEKSGIPMRAMSIISFGETKPVAGNNTSVGRGQNRRVVIRVIEQEDQPHVPVGEPGHPPPPPPPPENR